MSKCLNCGKELNQGKKYCSNLCQSQYEQKIYITRWLNGKESGIRGKGQLSAYIRSYIFKINNYRCSKCGWGEKNQFSNRVPLEIHHLDSNTSNNSIENLQLLCPNCHSLTKSWKGLNRSSFRKYRRK